MAVKPTLTPRWANVGGDIVEPTSGKKDVGWIAEEKPPAQYFNWLLNLTYQWLLYLNDGVLDGDHQFLDNVDIDGTLNVDGLSTFAALQTTAGDIRHAAVESRYPMHMFGNGVTVGNLTYAINATGNSYIESAGGTVTVHFDLPLKAGDRLTNVKAYVYGNTGGFAIVLKAWKIGRSTATVPATVGTQLGSTSTSGTSANMQLLSIGATTETVADPLTYLVAITMDINTRLYAIHYTVDRVA